MDNESLIVCSVIGIFLLILIILLLIHRLYLDKKKPVKKIK